MPKHLLPVLVAVDTDSEAQLARIATAVQVGDYATLADAEASLTLGANPRWQQHDEEDTPPLIVLVSDDLHDRASKAMATSNDAEHDIVSELLDLLPCPDGDEGMFRVVTEMATDAGSTASDAESASEVARALLDTNYIDEDDYDRVLEGVRALAPGDTFEETIADLTIRVTRLQAVAV